MAELPNMESDVGTPVEQHASPQVRKELRRRWNRSPWRILPLPITSFLLVGTYFSAIGMPDAWMRAIGPVIAILVFTTLAPYIRKQWFEHTRRKLENRE
jgi:hypothetical protein